MGAILAGLLGATAIHTLMGAFVRASTPPLAATDDGALGEINAPIRSDAPGEVAFTLEGLRRTAPARSLDGAPLPRGTKVVIVRREQGIAWVAPLDALDSLAEPSDVPRPSLPPLQNAGKPDPRNLAEKR